MEALQVRGQPVELAAAPLVLPAPPRVDGRLVRLEQPARPEVVWPPLGGSWAAVGPTLNCSWALLARS